MEIFFSYGSNTITEFKQTPPMSTYLIAFVVSDFKHKQNSNESSFPHRVFGNTNDFETAEFAVPESEKILNAIGDYLSVPFSLPKMDQVAIPDFAAGGKNSI